MTKVIKQKLFEKKSSELSNKGKKLYFNLLYKNNPLISFYHLKHNHEFFSVLLKDQESFLKNFVLHLAEDQF